MASWVGNLRGRQSLSFEAGVTALLLLGAILRLATLGQQSLWTDEATTYTIVAHGLGHVVRAVPATESTPPVYYVVLWFWTRVFGSGAVGLRSLSAVCGIGTIGVIAITARALWDERAGLAAAALTALSPIMVWYSQEARAYALGILLTALSLLLIIRASETLSPRPLLLWGLCAALALGTHYFTVFVLVPEAAWLVMKARRTGTLTVSALAACLAPPLLVGGALLPLLIHQADGRASFIGSDEGTLARRLVRLVKQDILGLNEPAKAVLSTVAVLLIIAVVLLAFSSPRTMRRRQALPVTVVLAGLLLSVLAAAAGSDYIDTRNLLFLWPALALIAAGAIAGTIHTRAAIGVLAALSALQLVCVVSIVATPLYQRADWRDLARALGRAPTTPRVLIGSYYTTPSLAPYQPGVRPVTAPAIRVAEIDVFDLSLQNTPPLRPIHLPAPPSGFRLAKERTGATYTLLTYVSRSPIPESVPALQALGANTGLGANPVFVQAGTNG